MGVCLVPREAQLSGQVGKWQGATPDHGVNVRPGAVAHEGGGTQGRQETA